MSEKKVQDAAAREYGVAEQIPDEDRHMDSYDMLATLAGAQCNPTSWYTGGVIAASGIGGAIIASLISSPIVFGALALVGYMGYKVSTTSMGLSRVPFGIRGSIIPSIINIVLNIGWNGLGCYLAAISLSYLFNGLFGWPVYGDPNSAWVMVLGVSINVVLSTLIVYIGGSRAIKIFEKVIVVIMVILSIWITVAVFSTVSLSELLAWRPDPEFQISTGAAMDTATANIFCWVICVAEFSRYAKTKVASSISPMVGSILAFVFFVFTGAVGVIGASINTGVFDPNLSDPSSVAINLGMGWAALVVVLAAVITTDVTGLYVSVMACGNIKTEFNFKKMTLLLGLITEILSVFAVVYSSIYDVFAAWLSFLGILIPPLAAIMIVDYYVVKHKYINAELANENGPYWYKNGWNPWAYAVWGVGMVISWFLGHIGFGAGLIGSVIPGFLITGLIYWVVAKKALPATEMHSKTA